MTWLMDILGICTKEQVLKKKLNDKASNIAKNSKYYGYQHRLASMLYDGLLIKTLLVMLLHVHGQRP